MMWTKTSMFLNQLILHFRARGERRLRCTKAVPSPGSSSCRQLVSPAPGEPARGSGFIEPLGEEGAFTQTPQCQLMLPRALFSQPCSPAYRSVYAVSCLILLCYRDNTGPQPFKNSSYQPQLPMTPSEQMQGLVVTMSPE
jgi:hypothetical protein